MSLFVYLLSNVSMKTESYFGSTVTNNVEYGLKCMGNESDINDCNRTIEHANCDKNIGINCCEY